MEFLVSKGTRRISWDYPLIFTLPKRTKNGFAKIRIPPVASSRRSWSQTSFFWQPSVGILDYTEGSEYEWPKTIEDKRNYGLNTYGPDVEMDFNLKFIEESHNEEKPFFLYHTTHLGHTAENYLRQKSSSGDLKVTYPGTPKVNWDGHKYTRVTPNITGDKGNYDTRDTITEPGQHTHVNYLDYQVCIYAKDLKNSVSKRIPFLSSQRIMEQLNTVRTSFIDK
jgi:hypothetical protein